MSWFETRRTGMAAVAIGLLVGTAFAVKAETVSFGGVGI